MGNSITLIPVKRAGADKHTLTGSLQAHGMNRAPGCRVTIPPYPDRDGSYRTGMDENALYIKEMELAGKKEEAELERARVRLLREELEARSGLDLGPRSKYFTQMGKGSKNDRTVGKFAVLPDDTVILSDSDVEQAIMAAWLQVHPQIAPSWEHFNRNPKSQYLYYISNPEAEDKIIYDENKRVARATVELDKMTPPEMKRVARLLDLPVTEDSPERNVFNQLFKYIKQGEVKQDGAYKGRRAVSVFNEVLDMSEELLILKDLIKQALLAGIYRKTKGVIFEGEHRISDSEAELVKELQADTQERISLEKKIKSKKIVNG